MAFDDPDYARAEERIKKEIDSDKLARCKDSLEVKQLLLEYFKQGDWIAKKSKKFVDEMTRRVGDYKGTIPDIPVREPANYFKAIAQRKHIEYQIREDGRISFKKVDGSFSKYHSANKAIFFIRRRRINE